MYHTTLNKIRKESPCAEGWETLLKHLGKTKADDEPVSLLTILNSNGIDDAIWCLRAVDNIDRDARLFAVWCARQVQHLMTDERSIHALNVAEKFANGEATEEELAEAAEAAWAAGAAGAAGAAAGAAAEAAAWAAWAAEAAGDAGDAEAAGDAAWAAVAAAWAAQKQRFIEVFCQE